MTQDDVVRLPDLALVLERACAEARRSGGTEVALSLDDAKALYRLARDVGSASGSSPVVAEVRRLRPHYGRVAATDLARHQLLDHFEAVFAVMPLRAGRTA